MLLQRLRGEDNGSPKSRESVIRVLPAEIVQEAAANMKTPRTELLEVKRPVARWHVQQGGDVILLQKRIGVGTDNKPGKEIVVVARIPAAAAGSFADVHVTPPPVAAGRTPVVYWSRGGNGVFVLYQKGEPVPFSGVSAARL